MKLDLLAPLVRLKSSAPLVKFRLWIPLMQIKSWFPLVAPSPFTSFPRRLAMKWLHILRLIVRMEGAQVIGKSQQGSALLKLRRNCALGPKGSVLEIPIDHVIYESVRHFGSWEFDEAKFLASALKRATESKAGKAARVALLDIGANSGLVALQAMNLAKTTNSVFLFEPVPQYAEAIKTNLNSVKDVHICNFALSNRNDEALMYTEASNHGNTSLFEKTVPAINRVKQTIRLVDTAEYFLANLNSYDKYVIKCDTQGMDALILSNVPEAIWAKTEGAIIEVTALPEIDVGHVDSLLDRIKDFNFMSWHESKGAKLDVTEIRDFWLNKSERHKNLYLRRSG